MKLIYLILFFLLSTSSVNLSLQSPFSMRIVYESYNELSDSSFEGLDPAIAAKLSSVNQQIKRLYNYTWVEKTSKYALAPKNEQPELPASVQISGLGKGYTFMDFNNDKLIKYTKHDGHDVVVDDCLPVFDWILEDNQKEILGYQCMSAYVLPKCYTKKVIDTIRVFFTPDIPVSGGPDIYAGLPGTILELNTLSANSTRIVKAREISFNKSTKDDVDFETPKKLKSKTYNELCE